MWGEFWKSRCHLLHFNNVEVTYLCGVSCCTVSWSASTFDVQTATQHIIVSPNCLYLAPNVFSTPNCYDHMPVIAFITTFGNTHFE